MSGSTSRAVPRRRKSPEARSMSVDRFDRVRVFSVVWAAVIAFAIAYLATIVLGMYSCAMSLGSVGGLTCAWTPIEMSIRAAGYVAMGALIAFMAALVDGGIDVRV